METTELELEKRMQAAQIVSKIRFSMQKPPIRALDRKDSLSILTPLIPVGNVLAIDPHDAFSFITFRTEAESVIASPMINGDINFNSAMILNHNTSNRFPLFILKEKELICEKS